MELGWLLRCSTVSNTNLKCDHRCASNDGYEFANSSLEDIYGQKLQTSYNREVNEFKSILEKSFKSNHEEAEKKVLSHIQNNWKDQNHSKDFLSDGFTLLKDPALLGKQNCIFCGQDLKNATELISAYRDFFNDEYTETKNEILGKSQKFLLLQGIYYTIVLKYI